MITDELKTRVDNLWDVVSQEGISNPLTAIEQITFLMFSRLLDIAETRAAEASFSQSIFSVPDKCGTYMLKGIFRADHQHLRWSHFKQLGADEMLRVMSDEVFPHFGTIHWVRVSKLARRSLWPNGNLPPRDESTLLLWSPETKTETEAPVETPKEIGAVMDGRLLGPTPEHSRQLVATFLDRSKRGDAARGLLVFSAAKSACLGCHQIGEHGGTVGPSLTELGKQRKPAEIVESVIWPQHHVRPEFESHIVVTDDGVVHKGYILAEDQAG